VTADSTNNTAVLDQSDGSTCLLITVISFLQ